jgi:hypothetical protein
MCEHVSFFKILESQGIPLDIACTTRILATQMPPQLYIVLATATLPRHPCQITTKAKVPISSAMPPQTLLHVLRKKALNNYSRANPPGPPDVLLLG